MQKCRNAMNHNLEPFLTFVMAGVIFVSLARVLLITMAKSMIMVLIMVSHGQICSLLSNSKAPLIY